MKEKEFVSRTSMLSGGGDKELYGGTLSKSVMCINDNTENFEKRLKYAGYSAKTMQDSRLFGELFEQLKSHNSSYCTYLNPSFNCAPSKVILPHFVYCFVKEIRPSNVPSTICGETLTPQMANLMNVPTVYNVFIEKDNDDSVSPYSKIASVDFTPYGYEFEDLSNLGAAFNESDSIQYCVEDIEFVLNRLKKEGKINLNAKDTYKVLSGFIDQLLFRNMLCEDADFGAKNMGLLIGENGECAMAPIFDLEYMFCGKRPPCRYSKFVEDGFKYLYPKYSSALDSFMSRLEICDKEQSLQKIVKNANFLTDFRRYRILRLLSGNIKTMQEEWNKIRKKSAKCELFDSL